VHGVAALVFLGLGLWLFAVTLSAS
jgi:hypothetical protein